jgi:hypothetical protein
MTIDDSANQHVYGKNVSGRDILLSGNVAPARVFTPFLTALKQETHLAKASTESSRETEKQKVDNKTPVSESAVKNNGVERENEKSAQESLKAKGFYEGEVDGITGPKTRQALRKYQKSEGLAVTGRFDSPTAERLWVGL